MNNDEMRQAMDMCRTIRAGVEKLQSDLAAAQKRITELETSLREVIGMWPEHRHGPVKLPPMSVQREVFGRANKALNGAKK